MGCGMPGFPILHYLLDFAQTHVHWVGDAIQPSHPLSSPFPASGSFPMSYLFTSGSQSIGASASASVLLMNIQGWLISFKIDWLYLRAVRGTLKSLLQFQSINSLALSLIYTYTYTVRIHVIGPLVSWNGSTKGDQFRLRAFTWVCQLWASSLPGGKKRPRGLCSDSH